MIPCKPIIQKLTLIFFLFLTFSNIKIYAQDGKALFQSKCASCHNVFRDVTGPKLGGVFDKDPYNGDVKKFLHWAYNTNSLTNSDPHYMALKGQFGSVMTQFNESNLS